MQNPISQNEKREPGCKIARLFLQMNLGLVVKYEKKELYEGSDTIYMAAS